MSTRTRVAKWNKRTLVGDLPTGPQEPRPGICLVLADLELAEPSYRARAGPGATGVTRGTRCRRGGNILTPGFVHGGTSLFATPNTATLPRHDPIGDPIGIEYRSRYWSPLDARPWAEIARPEEGDGFSIAGKAG